MAGFSSPRSHAQAAEALLAEGDLDGAAGLLVHWASLLEGTAVERTGGIWLAAAERWLARATADRGAAARGRIRRFLELVEANTSGVVDLLEAAAVGREPGGDEGPVPEMEDDDEADAEERVAAAYESMVWQDSADDGVEGGMLDAGGTNATPTAGLLAIEEAAEFLTGVLKLFRGTIAAWCGEGGMARPREEVDSVLGWRHSIRRLKRTFVRAAGEVAKRDSEPPPGMPPQEFDRLRWQRDTAAERLIDAAILAEETLWTISAWLHLDPARESQTPRGAVGRFFAAAVRGETDEASRWLVAIRRRLRGKPVLYVPLSRGGRPDTENPLCCQVNMSAAASRLRNPFRRNRRTS
ncbi:MAG: hypothetical protein NZ658_08940, partial [Pirellulales bacterium]|nr:hypothetical protein [Pirellulales bacterium]